MNPLFDILGEHRTKNKGTERKTGITLHAVTAAGEARVSEQGNNYSGDICFDVPWYVI